MHWGTPSQVEKLRPATGLLRHAKSERQLFKAWPEFQKDSGKKAKDLAETHCI